MLFYLLKMWVRCFTDFWWQKKGYFNRFPATEFKDPEAWPCRTMTDDHVNYPNITAQL